MCIGKRITTLLLAVLVSFCGGMACGHTPSKESAVNLNQIPAGLTVEAQLVRLTRPIVKMVEGKGRSVSELIEFRVVAKSAFPTRALDPMLAVGNHLVTDYRYVHENELLFTEAEPAKVPNGEVVYFQWGVQPAPAARQATALKFDREKLQVVTREPGKNK